MRASVRLQLRSVFAYDVIFARVRYTVVAEKALPIVVCSLVTALSQASSPAVIGGTVVVGATVVAVAVVGVDAAVDVPVLPAHPPTSRISRTVTARRAAWRPVLAGMRKPLQRGNATRVACHATWCGSANWREAS